MKKMIALVIALTLGCIALAGCAGGASGAKAKTYDDEKAALAVGEWYFEGDASNELCRLTFTEDTATDDSVYFDGNGIHNGNSSSASYSIDDNMITIEASGSQLTRKIPYTYADGVITLGEGYFTSDQVLQGLQGNWTYKTSSVEYNLTITGNTMEFENASKSALAGYDYFYYGPYSGEFKLGYGKFETDMKHGNEFFFMISDGKPIVLHFNHEMTVGSGLRGQDGYSF